MAISRFRIAPPASDGSDPSPNQEVAITTTTSDATAANMTTMVSLAGASRVLLFITVTTLNSATKISVKYRVSPVAGPSPATDVNWSFIRADNLTASTGVSATKPYVAEIDGVDTAFAAGEKTYVLSFPADGVKGSARIWSDSSCVLKASWMRKG